MEVFDFDSFAKHGFFIRKDPDTLLVGKGPFERQETPPARRGTALYAPDFFLREKRSWIVPQRVRQYSNGEFLQALETSRGELRCSSRAWSDPSPQSFFSTVQRLKEQFTRVGWKKGVPVVFERSSGCPSDQEKLALVYSALKAPPMLWSYGFWEHEEGIIGATPEILFRQALPGQVESFALAGTKDLEVPDNQFFTDSKELLEHDLVVQHISEAFSQWGEVKVGERELIRLPLLKHLKTKISLLSSFAPSFEALVKALHPTPALGGVPRADLVEFLEELDSEGTRGRFGAPFGVSEESGEALCLVGIRNVQWKGDSLFLGAGCGIVPQSNPEAEWAELALKRASVHSVLGI